MYKTQVTDNFTFVFTRVTKNKKKKCSDTLRRTFTITIKTHIILQLKILTRNVRATIYCYAHKLYEISMFDLSSLSVTVVSLNE